MIVVYAIFVEACSYKSERKKGPAVRPAPFVYCKIIFAIVLFIQPSFDILNSCFVQ